MSNLNKNNRTPWIKVDESPLHPNLEVIINDAELASKRINDFIDSELKKLLEDHPSIEIANVVDTGRSGTNEKYVFLYYTIGKRQ
jgi:hypothetical protein